MARLEQSGAAMGPVVGGRAGGGVAVLLRLEGGLEFGAAILVYALAGGGWLMFVVLLLVPDVAMLGYLLGNRVGALVYNAAHTYLAPALLAGIAWAVHAPTWVLLVAAIWAAHIGMDRLLGFGLKYPDGFKTTHLG